MIAITMFLLEAIITLAGCGNLCIAGNGSTGDARDGDDHDHDSYDGGRLISFVEITMIMRIVVMPIDEKEMRVFCSLTENIRKMKSRKNNDC